MYFSLHESADSNCSLSRPPSWRYCSFKIPQLQALQTRLMQKVWHICFGNPVQNRHLFPSQHIHNSCGQNGRCRQSTTKSILAWTRSEYFPAPQTHHNIVVVLHISFGNLAAIKPENGPVHSRWKSNERSVEGWYCDKSDTIKNWRHSEDHRTQDSHIEENSTSDPETCYSGMGDHPGKWPPHIPVSQSRSTSTTLLVLSLLVEVGVSVVEHQRHHPIISAEPTMWRWVWVLWNTSTVPLHYICKQIVARPVSGLDPSSIYYICNFM